VTLANSDLDSMEKSRLTLQALLKDELVKVSKSNQEEPSRALKSYLQEFITNKNCPSQNGKFCDFADQEQDTNESFSPPGTAGGRGINGN